MMTLAEASCYFDRTQATDVLTGRPLFKAQLSVFDDSKRDASAAYRRIMSVKPGTVMPASRLAKMLGHVWMIGASEPDGMLEIHREKYVIQAATTILKHSSLSQFLSGTYPNTIYSTPNWVKDAKQLEVSSDMPQIFDITVPGTTALAVHDVLWEDTAAYLVLSPRSMVSGLMVANTLKLEVTAPTTATITSRVYNPVTGAYTGAIDSVVNALVVRWQSLFKYTSQMSERYQEGDVEIVLPFGTVLTTASRIAVSGVTYQVLAVLDISGTVVAHARVA